MRLITRNVDATVTLWDVQPGAQLYTFKFVVFDIGDKHATITTDSFVGPSSVGSDNRMAPISEVIKRYVIFPEHGSTFLSRTWTGMMGPMLRVQTQRGWMI